MMATNTEGLAIFIRGKGHSREIFTQGREKILGPENEAQKFYHALHKI